MVDIHRDAKRRGIYPLLFTDPEGDSCFGIYQIRWIKKRLFNFFFWNFRETKRHFSLRSQNSEYPRVFQVSGANQNARKLLSTDLVNTNTKYWRLAHRQNYKKIAIPNNITIRRRTDAQRDTKKSVWKPQVFIYIYKLTTGKILWTFPWNCGSRIEFAHGFVSQSVKKSSASVRFTVPFSYFSWVLQIGFSNAPLWYIKIAITTTNFVFVLTVATAKYGMYCDLCQTRKLRREFPSDTITDKCEHAPLHCLRVSCVIYCNLTCSTWSEALPWRYHVCIAASRNDCLRMRNTNFVPLKHLCCKYPWLQ